MQLSKTLFLSTVSAIIASASLIGCGGDDDTEKETTDTTTSTTTSTETTTDTETETTTTETDTDIDVAKVRVVHLSPDAPGVDVYANGEAVGVNNVTFPAGSAYLEVPIGEYEFEVVPAGGTIDDAVPVSLTADLEADKAYTAIAHGLLGGTPGFAITAFADDLTEPTDGNFKVQVIHAAAGLNQVDIWNITDPDNPAALIEDFDYGASVTTELPTGIAFTLGVDVDNDANPDAVFKLPDTLTGYVGLYAATDANGAPFLFAHFEDGTTARINPEPPPAMVRVVHLSPDAPAVDIYANGQSVGVNDVAFPAGSGYLTVPSGAYNFELVPAGGTIDDAVAVNLEVDLEPAKAYTAIAHGLLAGTPGFAINGFENDLSPISEGMFRVQVIHAAAGLGQVDIWNITDPNSPSPIIQDFDYGTANEAVELPLNTAFVLGVDLDDDANPDAVFNIPSTLTGFVGVYAVTDATGAPFLFAHLEDGTTVRIDPS